MAGALEREIGDVLDDRYRLLRRLGRGGFGDVWRAEELLPDGTPLREVALKLLRPDLASASDWAAEARIIASLPHPALVTVYAAGLIPGDPPQPFVAMELLIGDALNEWVARGQRVPWRRVLSWACQTASALDVIHRAGVVHLDLKPANLFLDAEGKLKVLDFGIARQGGQQREQSASVLPELEGDDMSTAAFMVAVEEEHAHTSARHGGTGTVTRSVVGTPGFMAPEIFEDGEATPAADAYALAACIVQLCTGQLPQDIGPRPASQEQTAMQTWYAEVQHATVRGLLRDLASNHVLPDALVALVRRWLTLDPVARQVSAGDLGQQLEAVWQRPWADRTDNPYKGLEPYGPKDEGWLLGRAGDASRFALELQSAPCLLLHAPGGSGLTSLVLAGIIPELARAFADGRDDWSAIHLDLTHASEEDIDHANEQLDLALEHTSPRSHAAGSAVGIAIVADGLDHALTNPALRKRIASLTSRRAGVRLIAIASDDPQPIVGDGGVVAFRPWLRFVSGVPPGQAESFVKGHAAADSRNAIANDIRDELDSDASRLPFISLALQRWWTAVAKGDANGWQTIGGVMGALCQHADAVFTELAPRDRTLVEELLVRLVSGDGKARAADRTALVSRFDQPDEVDRLVGLLIKRRIVVSRRGELALAHPALAQRWRRLDDLRMRNIERLHFVEGLGESSSAWNDAGRPRSALWSARRLREFSALEDDIGPDLGDEERAFIVASRRGVRLRRIINAAIALAVIGAFIGAWSLERARERNQVLQKERLEQARRDEAIGRMVTRSRRTSDPYKRVALLSGAIAEDSSDPVLPLELYEAAKALPRADFLALDPLPRPAFPWGKRWLIGGDSHIEIYDFEPLAGAEWAPMIFRFRPHVQDMYDYVPFEFDSAFVTRGLGGELRVWRLREQGQIELAAVAPIRCMRGQTTVLVAARAPVIACNTGEGLARWDLRKPEAAQVDPFQGRALDISPDGEWVAAARLKTVVLWHGASGKRHEFQSTAAPSVARFSPRDPLLALGWAAAVEVLEFTPDGIASPLLKRDTLVSDTVDMAWSSGGLDLAVCDYSGSAEWLYLRDGDARDPADGPRPREQRPCEGGSHEWPKRLYHVRDYGELMQRAPHLGPRQWRGGWQTEDKKVITRDLVMFDEADARAINLLQFQGRPKKGASGSDSVLAVSRDGDGRSVWQVGDDIVFYDDASNVQLMRRGRLLASCDDGRLVSWRRDEQHWTVFEARHDRDLFTVKRRPGFILGSDPECQRIYFQWHDGTLATVPIDGSSKERQPTVAPAPGDGFVLGGYVYDARPSHAGDGVSAGLWLALSSGAVVRADATGNLTAYGHANPRATALGDGPTPGTLLFADATGVTLRSPKTPDEHVLGPIIEREWEDLLVNDEMLLLASAHGLALLDMKRKEIVGELETPPRGRIARWGDEGSVLLWPYSFMGPARGDVIPFGPGLAQKLAAAVSNLAAKLDDDLRPRTVLTRKRH